MYLAKVDVSPESLVLGEGQALQFFKASEIKQLKISYGLKALLDECFLAIAGNPHVHHA
jgi:hypothetical protein